MSTLTLTHEEHSSSYAQPQPLPIFALNPMECPFGWMADQYFATRQIQFFPENTNPTISFTETKRSKIISYIPIIGTIKGIFIIFRGYQEYQLFSNTHLHALSKRSIQWILRGVIVTIPIFGGIICAIIDFAATVLNSHNEPPRRLEDETPCGYCHICNLCRC